MELEEGRGGGRGGVEGGECCLHPVVYLWSDVQKIAYYCTAEVCPYSWPALDGEEGGREGG